jgi:DNA-directed RNA polymerase subunit RPC12/RpoP
MAQSKDYPVCPYCGEKHEDVYSLQNGDNTIECECGETYLCKVVAFTFEKEDGEMEEVTEYNTRKVE